MALAGMFLAVVIALPLGIVIGARMPGWRLLYAVLAASALDSRSYACHFLRNPRGPRPWRGDDHARHLLLRWPWPKFSGKYFSVPILARSNALRSTGASRLSIAAFGLIPLKLSDVLSYGVYELESAIRASVIVGAVGAGGIGTELVGSLNDFDYRRVTTLILALVLLIVLVDRFCWLVRRHPSLWRSCRLQELISLVYCWPQIFAMRHSI